MYKPDIICITEVMLKNSYIISSNPMYVLDGYNIIDSHLQDRGIIIYGKPHIKVQVLSKQIKFQEYILCKIVCGKESLILCIVYRSPNSTFPNDVLLLDLLSYLISIKKDQLLIIGDFNYSKINWSLCCSTISTGSSSLFLDKLQEFFLEQLVTEPTRFRQGQNPSLLDLVLTDNSHFVYDIVYSNPLGCSDHISLYISLNFSVIPPLLERRLFYKADYEAINCYLEDIDWKLILLDKNTQE